MPRNLRQNPQLLLHLAKLVLETKSCKVSASRVVNPPSGKFRESVQAS